MRKSSLESHLPNSPAPVFARTQPLSRPLGMSVFHVIGSLYHVILSFFMSRPLGVSVAKNLGPVGYRKGDDLMCFGVRGWD